MSKENQEKKAKPRGRPFPKGNKNGKIPEETMVVNGLSLPPIKIDEDILDPKKYQDVKMSDIIDSEPKIVEEISFTNGKHKLSIVLRKKQNRVFRIQIFLDDNTEIKPSTYNGSSPAMGYWNLLKSSIEG